ncbi:hypothetical protein JCM5353_005229 [Sporobolomyces roseus]
MSGRGNQHRQQAFEELFRRPAPSSSSSSSSRPPTQQHPSSHQQQQQQQQYYSYPGTSAYPDYPPNQPQNAYNQFGVISNGGGGTQMPHAHLQGYNPPPNRPGTVSSYRSSSSQDQRASYFEQPGGGGANQYQAMASQQQYGAGGGGGSGNSQAAYEAQQQYAQRGYQPSQQYQQPVPPPPPSMNYNNTSQGYYGSSDSSHDPYAADPTTPVPPQGAAARYSSPRSQYAPTMSSGPPTASTSTSLFSRPSTSSVSSLPYSYPESISNGHDSPLPSRSPPPASPASVLTAPLPLVPGYGPPRLPDIPQGSDDFFSNQNEALWQAQSQSAGRRSSRESAAGGITPTPLSSYGRKASSPAAGYIDETDSAYGYDNPYQNSVFDRSRRSSTESDRRSLYQPPPTHQTLMPVNPSVNSLPYPYGNGNSFAASNPALQARKSSESMRVFSNPPRALTSSISSLGHDSRALSFSSIDGRPDMKRSMDSAATVSSYPTARPPSHGSIGATSLAGQPGANAAPRRNPVVYPALLSRVAEAFKERIISSERIKDGLVYSDAFDGRDAVDKIAYIIKTSDRNLALLLGRALDAQKFFHDVTYDHRLRDSPVEIYRFKERLSGPFLSSDDLAVPEEHQQLAQHPHAPGSAAAHAQAVGEAQGGGGGGHGRTPSYGYSSSNSHAPYPHAQPRPLSAAETLGSVDDSPLPSGVFTLLTDCYSPTCTRDRLCYSIACPRRLEQQARLNLKREGLSGGLEGVGGLKRSDSVVSLGDLREPGTLWIHSVPQDIIDSTSDSEKKRQEGINEVFYTERDFVRDLEYLRDFWIKPLRSQNIIPEARREDFVTQVFWNVLEIYAVNVRLADLLNKRQKQAHVVDHVGDIFLDLVPHFAPFVKYGAHQLYGKYEFEKEKGSNPAFAKFVEDTERLPESRKLELNAYLTKPTTRLARYPLLLDACLKNTPEDNPDKIALPKVIKLVREFLGKVNIESGKSENRFNLAQLDQQLVFKNGEAVDLRLRDEERELIYKGPLKKRGGTQSESAELQVFLFDHAILMVKQKSKNEQYKVYRKPIPLELLVVAAIDDAATARSGVVRPKSLMARGSSGNKSTSSATAKDPPPGVDKNSKQGFAITFIHLGRRGYQITLWASTWTARKKWLEKIEERQNELRERSLVFETVPLSAGYFVGTNRLTCAAPFDNGNRMVYGTENGVYLADLRDKAKVPVKVISVPNVTQLDVLEEQGILIVLADKAVQTFFVDHLDPGDAVGAAKRARKISAHATFFKAGQCLGRTLVCVVKSGNVSSTIKTLEPIDQVRGKKQPAIRKFLQGSNESLRVFKEFYIPTESSSVHFLKSKLCVGCTKGFEIVDLETLDTQGLLDPADSSLDFVQKRESAKPVAIYRIDGEFLLCYDEFAFYVNKNGWRAKSNWIIQWEGFPTSFALHYPYVLAFEPTFIEVRHVESGALMQIIPGNNIRCLFQDSPPSASSSAAPYYSNNSRYGSPYGQQSRFPSPSTRNEIIVCDGDRAFSLFSPSV